MYDALADVRARLGTTGAAPALPPPEPRASFRPAEASSSQTPSALSSTVLDRGAEAASTAGAPAHGGASAPPWRLALVAGAAVAGATAIFFASRGPGEARVATPYADAAAVVPPPASIERAAPPSTAEAREAGAADTEAPPAPATAASPTPTPRAPKSAAPRCEAHEVLSNGHCCPRGKAWQDGRCERPLATTF
jgi:hypothetical protein